ncbi:MAG: sporulation transcription factor Spo0A [Clostridia bacterium]|nr:sporulation transcription factor Spo0A [Clostridia bacterium]
MKTRILVIDDNFEFAEEVRQALEKQNYEVDIACNGREGLSKSDGVECILLDLVMPVMDGFAFLEKFDKKSTKIIAISALSQDVFIARAMEKGCDYYLIKPTPIDAIVQKVEDALSPKTLRRTVKNKTLEERITKIFISVGIPPHIKGYQYLREAIKLSIEDPDIINSITKKLYPGVAAKFDTSPSKVERAIRHAIEVGWNRGKIENINSLFGVRVYSQNEKPTNGEFIALVADKLLLESV